MVVIVTIDSKQAEIALNRISTNLPRVCSKMTKAIADDMLLGMQLRVRWWHRHLYDSLRVVETENGHTVNGLSYWKALERGHLVIALPPKLIQWASEKSLGNKGRMQSILTTLITEGAEAHPFVGPAFDSTISRLPRTAGTEMKKIFE